MHDNGIKKQKKQKNMDEVISYLFVKFSIVSEKK